MRRHSTRDSHTTASKQIRTATKLDSFVGKIAKVQRAEVRLVAWAVEHNKAMQDVEDFAQLSKAIFGDSEIAKSISIGRTKATAITNNVLGATHHEELANIMKENKFSLMIDESTDVATKKALVMVVRASTWSKDKLCTRDYFYHVIELVEADADTIHHAIVGKFEQDGIPYKDNLIGFAADGANVMLGGKHSVAALLKKDCPSLFILKCICHSFALCASYACKNIPSYVEQTCKDIYAFLSNSPLRSAKFDQLQSILELKPLKMLHPSATRWLSLQAVVERLLERLDALKIYFSYHDATVDRRQVEKMEKIKDNLNNPLTELYLTFLAFILPRVNNLNRLFQSENPQIYKLNAETKRLLMQILENFMRPDYIMSLRNVGSFELEESHYCELQKIYVGINVQRKLDMFVATAKLKEEDVKNFYLNIMNFYITTANQIKKRINLEDEVMNELAILDPVNVRRKIHASLYPLVKHFQNILSITDLQQLDDEFREIRCMELPEDIDVNDGPQFWGQILSTRRFDGELAFPLLHSIIPAFLALPHSSAKVERIFSTYNLNKTKTRNRILTKNMDGILSAKEYVITHKNPDGVVEVVDAAKKRFTNEMYNM